MKYIRKSLKIHCCLIKQEIKCFLEYKSDFIIGIVSFFIGQGFNIVFIEVIFSGISNLSGWTLEEILFIYGFSLLPKGLDHLFFDNLWSISNFTIRNGDFDKYLIRPINPLFYVMIEKLQLDALGELVVGTTIVFLSSSYLSLEINVIKIILVLVSVVFATLIYTSIKIITAALAFWTKTSGNIMYTFYMMSDFVRYPVSIYNDSVKFIITYIFPFAFTTFYPVKYILTGKNSFYNIGLTVIVSLALLTIAVIVWNIAIRNYESVGN